MKSFLTSKMETIRVRKLKNHQEEMVVLLW
jgi:hypothetical protein